MMKNKHIHRPVAVLAMLLGAAMIFLGSETWAGALVFALGLLIEGVGVALSHDE